MDHSRFKANFSHAFRIAVDFATLAAGPVFCVSVFRTSCRFRFCLGQVVDMRKPRNRSLFYMTCVIAASPSFQAFLVFGRFLHNDPVAIGMPRRRGLFRNLVTAVRAYLLSASGFRAGRFLHDNPVAIGMVSLRDRPNRRLINLAADGAVDRLGALLQASRRLINRVLGAPGVARVARVGVVFGIFMVGDGQRPDVVVRMRLVIVHINDVGARLPVIAAEHVLRVDRAGIVARHKELVACANRPLIAVRHVNQVVLAVPHVDDVPHVRTLAGSAVHRARRGDAIDVQIEVGLVAQIFERLGIALADHIRRRILVKNPNHLPRIAKTHTAPSCLIVIGHKVADLVFVPKEFVVV